MNKPEDIRVTLDGIGFHYRDWHGEGQPVVLLHGLASTSHIWDLVAPVLSADFAVVALDQRGHGESDKPESGYDFVTVAQDLQRFIEALGLRNPVVVGLHVPNCELFGGRSSYKEQVGSPQLSPKSLRPVRVGGSSHDLRLRHTTPDPSLYYHPAHMRRQDTGLVEVFKWLDTYVRGPNKVLIDSLVKSLCRSN